MTTLLRSEVRRLVSRRAVRLLAAGAAAVMIAVGVGNWVAADPLSPFAYIQVLDLARGLSGLVLVVAFAAGASYAGAEWGTGSLAVLLTWEPRRGRVLGAKAAALAASAAVTGFALLTLLVLAHLPAGTLAGSMAGVDAGWVGSLAWVVARGAVLAVIGATIGLGLAVLARNTAAAVGVGFVYALMVDPLLALWREGRLAPWLVQRNIAAFLGVPTFVCPPQQGPVAMPCRELTVTRAGLLLGLYAAVLLALAWAAFRARDV